jgi:chromosome segregation ATPase|tara:strand:- start:180 stop:539 length:360 start_codon:yes stop_codon:yes gene_type:complete
MKNENISTTTLLLAFNILLVLIGLLMINKKILNNDEQSNSLKTKIDQIETQLDVLIDDAKTAKDKVIVANEDFIQLSNSMAVNDKILKNLNSEIKGAVKEIKEVKNMTELQNRKLYISE